jgi:8-oxo-dGTP pyrophosphatase MutT (NUDIX family)
MSHPLPELLKARLRRPLPGPAVRSRYAPRSGSARHDDRAPPDARQAAVLLLLYPHEGRWHLPLTLRPSHLPDHAGQVCLPGGAIELGETSQQAAIREFHEELGAAGHPMEMLGRLSPVYLAVSGFRVEPWVAAADGRPPLAPNPAEVEMLLEVPLDHLLDAANFGSHQRRDKGPPYIAPHFGWQSYRIWGATCLILGELVTLVEELGTRGEP